MIVPCVNGQVTTYIDFAIETILSVTFYLSMVFVFQRHPSKWLYSHVFILMQNRELSTQLEEEQKGRQDAIRSSRRFGDHSFIQ